MRKLLSFIKYVLTNVAYNISNVKIAFIYKIYTYKYSVQYFK